MDALQTAAFLRLPAASGHSSHLGLSEEEAHHLGAFLAQSRNVEFEVAPPLGNAERGAKLVVTTGCLNCHTLSKPEAPSHNQIAAPPLMRLRFERGCSPSACWIPRQTSN